jgi:hypothetical protein
MILSRSAVEGKGQIRAENEAQVVHELKGGVEIGGQVEGF